MDMSSSNAENFDTGDPTEDNATNVSDDIEDECGDISLSEANNSTSAFSGKKFCNYSYHSFTYKH